MAKFDSIAMQPKGARLYGYGGLDEGGKLAVSRAALPRWLLALLPDGHRDGAHLSFPVHLDTMGHSSFEHQSSSFSLTTFACTAMSDSPCGIRLLG
jgi:hypothetical protein